jgi:cobalt-zinc-cadmium efflux system outer membrane protein
MPFRYAALCALAWALVLASPEVRAEPTGPLTLSKALQRAAAANPKLIAAGREIGVATGKHIQAGAIPNPEIAFELDSAFGTGEYRGLRSAETTLQISQLIELGGKRDARIRAASAELESARWERDALRLEILSDTAVAFFNVLGGQRKVQIFDGRIAALDRLTPLLQRRVDAGASSPGEVGRVHLAADLVRAERERARTALAISRRELAIFMGATAIDFGYVVGDLNAVASPPAFAAVLRGIERNPELIKLTAIRAQRDAALLTERLKPIPDVKVEFGWKHIREPAGRGSRGDDAFKLGVSIPIPAWDDNLGNISAAEAARSKADAEQAAGRATLILTLTKAYDTANGSLREIEILQSSALPNARKAVEALETGYSGGRFSLLEILDAQSSASEASLRELEALTSFHTSVATIEGLTGVRFTLTRQRGK